MYDQITASLFKQMVLHGAACITREKQAINDLNVFPVPDGDTGTNMSMTLAAAVTELQRKEPETVDQAASITASATPPASAGRASGHFTTPCAPGMKARQRSASSRNSPR